MLCLELGRQSVFFALNEEWNEKEEIRTEIL